MRRNRPCRRRRRGEPPRRNRSAGPRRFADAERFELPWYWWLAIPISVVLVVVLLRAVRTWLIGPAWLAVEHARFLALMGDFEGAKATLSVPLERLQDEVRRLELEAILIRSLEARLIKARADFQLLRAALLALHQNPSAFAWKFHFPPKKR